MTVASQRRRRSGPNRHPDLPSDPGQAKATIAAATAAAASASAGEGSGCRFLGHNFGDGETICYDDKVWICTMGRWVKTDVSC